MEGQEEKEEEKEEKKSNFQKHRVKLVLKKSPKNDIRQNFVPFRKTICDRGPNT